MELDFVSIRPPGSDRHSRTPYLIVTNTISLAMIPPTLYYSKVGLELGKLVFRGQNMSPP